MGKKYILHMISPTPHVSPFDVNMALDAGFDTVIPYNGVTDNAQVRSLVQDAIFSRSPSNAKRTGIFIGGKDAITAIDMMEAAKESMVPPFEISVFPDPAGSFTTAAALVACTEKTLKKKFSTTLKGLKVKIYGGKGIVGSISGVLCAQAGAEATLIGYDGVKNVADRAAAFKKRFNVDLLSADGSDDDKNTALLEDADIVFCAARAGTRVLSEQQLATAKNIKVAADVNAVPPSGIEGVGVKDDDKVLPCGAYSIGALTSGDIKVKTQYRMFEDMCRDDTRYLNFDEAARIARKICSVG